ncbi:MAG: NAD(P)H-dependent oxidoreductase subunit E [Candidatus Brocadiia bacterium]|nr:NAD(P)H-dependent oxidoreductase subunit E [Candidatus Brocadiia bacterium]
MKESPAAQTKPTASPLSGEIQAFLDERNVSPESNIITLLQDAQECLGYLPHGVLVGMSRRTGVPLSRIYGVVSFYAQFYTEPRGRHLVRVCRGTACHVRGGKSVSRTVEKVLGIKENETTDDMMFSFETVACLGACALAPVVVIDGVYYGKMAPGRIEGILRRTAEADSSGEGED